MLYAGTVPELYVTKSTLAYDEKIPGCPNRLEPERQVLPFPSVRGTPALGAQQITILPVPNS